MRAPILNQPLIAVVDGHIEKVDWDDRDNRPVWTGHIAQGKQRIGDRDVALDKADPIVRERRLRVAVDGLCLGTEVLHHCDVPLHKITLRRHEGSIFGE